MTTDEAQRTTSEHHAPFRCANFRKSTNLPNAAKRRTSPTNPVHKLATNQSSLRRHRQRHNIGSPHTNPVHKLPKNQTKPSTADDNATTSEVHTPIPCTNFRRIKPAFHHNAAKSEVPVQRQLRRQGWPRCVRDERLHAGNFAAAVVDVVEGLLHTNWVAKKEPLV
jgi:hypothetical protein